MAGEDQEQVQPPQPQKQPQQQQQKGQQQRGGGGGGGGGGQQRKRKELLDITNVYGGLIWLISFVLTTIALTVSVMGANPLDSVGSIQSPVQIQPVDPFGSGQVIPTPVPAAPASGGPTRGTLVLYTILGSFIAQAGVTIGQRRLKYPWNKYMAWIDWGFNLIGLYWLFVTALGVFAPVRAIWAVIWSNMGAALIAQIVFLLVLTVGLEKASSAFFDAPPK